MNELDGVVSGMVINFRMHDKTYFIRGDKLKKYVDLGNSRVSVEWLEINGVLIHQEKKRTRFRYDYEFLERIL
jgi:recombination protein U